MQTPLIHRAALQMVSLRMVTAKVKDVTDIMATPTAASYAVFIISHVFKYINKNYPLSLQSVRGMTPSMSQSPV